MASNISQGFSYVDSTKADFLESFVETDPSGRYGRFKEILGKGAMKIVYKAFDEFLGKEVAWNQVKLTDFFHLPDELQQLYTEVHLLKTLDHHSIIEFYTYWVDVDQRTFNFITEMFTSGTLREYRQKCKRVSIEAVKNWSRQILHGIAYLHAHEPPVIHRDLKCDNIFVNGHLGKVKIGDLGLAKVLRDKQQAHSVIGTPEFMAPELYEESYNELVDIYAFGMCVIEMVTAEYPYSECRSPAEIYKKVTSGKLPKAFYKIKDEETQRFVRKCLETASKRLSAKELLSEPFLACHNEESVLDTTPFTPKMSSLNGINAENLSMVNDLKKNTKMSITGTMNPTDDAVFLKVQISDQNGESRNIYFPYQIQEDTAIDVAFEMVKELEITDWEPMEIAKMIEDEISSLVPLHLHTSFHYKDADNFDQIHNPFHSDSSLSSSQASASASLPASMTHFPTENGFDSTYNYSQDYHVSYDDRSSRSSFSDVDYYSCSENDCEVMVLMEKEGEDEIGMTRETNSYTKICPGSGSKHCESSRSGLKMKKNKSMVDLRSQLLHKSLVEEISKRRLFQTVAGMEDIGD